MSTRYMKKVYGQDLILEKKDPNVDSDSEVPITDGVKPKSFNVFNLMNAINCDGETALHIAVKNKNLQQVTALISHGAKIDVESKENLTPLQIAIENASIEIIKTLLDAGADLNFETKFGKPFHVPGIDPKIVETFYLDDEIEVNKRYTDGDTMLHKLCKTIPSASEERPFLNFCKHILKLGAEINVVNNDDKTPLFYAVTLQNNEIMEIFINCNMDYSIQGNRLAVLEVCKLFNSRNHITLVQELIDAGYGLKELGEAEHGKFLLKLIKLNCDSIFLHLLRTGSFNPGTVLPYFYRDEVQRLNVLQILVIELARDILNSALDRCYPEDFNRRDKDGRPIFFLALSRDLTTRHVVIIRNLLIHGLNAKTEININTANQDGTTVFHYAVVANNAITMIEYLLKFGANINASTRHGLTPLHLALLYGKLENALKLVDCNANINAQDVYGRTPLHIAASRNMSQFVKFLLVRKADLLIEDVRDRRPYETLNAYRTEDSDLDSSLDIPWKLDIFGEPQSIDLDVYKRYDFEYNFLPACDVSSVFKKYLERIPQSGKRNVDLDFGKELPDKITMIPKQKLKIGPPFMMLLTEEDMNDKLKIAIWKGDISEVKNIISIQNLFENKLWCEGYEPLYFALKLKKLKCAEEILKVGANINYQPQFSALPTSKISLINNVFVNYDVKIQSMFEEPMIHIILGLNVEKIEEFLEQFLDRNPEINVTNCKGETALHIAVKNKNLQQVTALVSHGAKIDVESKENLTPLQIAIENASIEIIKTLLDAGADLNFGTKFGKPFHISEIDTDEIMKVYLENQTNVNKKDTYGDTMLHTLCKIIPSTSENRYYVNFLKYILKIGVDINAVNNDEKTPFFYAIKMRKFDILPILFDCKIDFNIEGNKLAVFLALQFLNIAEQILINCINCGFDFDVANEVNAEFLIKNIKNDNVKIIKYFCKWKIDFGTETVVPYFYCGEMQILSLLQIAVIELAVNIVGFLLKQGADFERKDKDGRNVLFLSISEELGSKNVKIAEELIKYGANVNSPVKNGTTVLHYAAASKNGTDMIDLLLNNAANINTPTIKKLTPLHVALLYRSSKNATKLVESNSDLNIQDDFGRTPLHVAISRKLVNFVKFFLTRRPDLSIEDARGKKPLEKSNRYTSEDEETNRYLDIPWKFEIFCERENREYSGFDEIGCDRLRIAIFNGNAEEVDRILASDFLSSPNTAGEYLYLALKMKRIKCAEEILKTVTDLDGSFENRSIFQEPLLHVALKAIWDFVTVESLELLQTILQRKPQLNEGSESDHDEETVVQHEEKSEEETLKVDESGTKRRKKKRRQKKAQKQQREEVAEDDGEDEIEKTVRQINQLLGEPEPSTSHECGSNSHWLVQKSKESCLTVQHKHLNPYNEQKRIFGSKTVQAELNRRRPKGRLNHVKKTWLVSVRESWLPVIKSGLSMTIDQKMESKDGIQYFVYEHSPSYKQVQIKFIHAVESLNPENIVSIVNQHPYHIDALLQVSELCKMSEDLPLAASLVERALFYQEYAFHPLFNMTTGNCRLDFKKQQNRAFFITLFKHILFVSGRACYRTSLELCKFLLSLEPEEDPLAVILAIDFYAIRAREYEWFVEFCNLWEKTRNLSQLPNVAYSLALAYFHMGNEDEAKEFIQNALIMFPGVLVPLMDKCGISMDSKVSGHDFFNIKAYSTTPPALEKLQDLYVARSFHLWKEPNVLLWLETQVHEVLDRVNARDEFVKYCQTKRAKRYQGQLPRNIMRHIILSDIKDVTVNLQPSHNERPLLSHDPLPPLDSIDIYTLPQPSNRRDNQTNLNIFSFFASFFEGRFAVDDINVLNENEDPNAPA